MDQTLINQLQFYTPPQLIKEALKSDKICYQVARHIIDREFKHKPQKWKTNAFADYDDFFQAAISGFNPYKESTEAEDKGLLQAVQSYNPYKKQEEVGELILKSLRKENEVAYIRYASVYRKFNGVKDFISTLESLKGNSKDQLASIL